LHLFTHLPIRGLLGNSEGSRAQKRAGPDNTPALFLCKYRVPALC
jgi:hypothetical protein